ncbi:MAG: hypothetical protein JNJ54_20385 [Myxococcaceae bacterium]|nr:hypothetical protein [Myxococcaceae bacterium]
MSALVLALALVAAPKLALPGFSGVLAPNEAQLYENVVANELSRGGLEVLTSRDVVTLIGLERQRQLMGCTGSTCLTGLIGALGADGVVLGDVGRLDGGYVVQFEVRASQHAQVLALFSGRAKDASELLTVLEGAAIDLQNQLALKWSRRDLKRAAPVQGAPDRRWVSAVVGGVGLASLAAGIALNLQADATLKQLQGTGPSESLATLVKLRDSGKTSEAMGYTFLAIGGAALATSVVLFFALAPDAPATVTVTPLPGGAALSFAGVWP